MDEEDPIKRFLKKPMGATTVGDHLMMHGTMVLMSLVITGTVQLMAYSLLASQRKQRM